LVPPTTVLLLPATSTDRRHCPTAWLLLHSLFIIHACHLLHPLSGLSFTNDPAKKEDRLAHH
jgi:hypothetical protein